MNELTRHFITADCPYTEGEVFVFEQDIPAAVCGKLRRATLDITALGVYEAEINGRKVGDALFAPGYTYYPRDLHYQSYDVTGMLEGAAVLRVFLGQGWYCGRFTCDNKTRIYGENAAVSWRLTMEGEDGGVTALSSDDAGVRMACSPYAYAGFYDGEEYYADGAPGREGGAPPGPVRYEGALPECCELWMPSVRLQEEMELKAVIRRGDATLLDFGQNFAGMVEIDPAKLEGETLRLRHGELLDQDGSLYTGNLRKAKAQIVYHKGAEETRYRPRFTYMGFRYVELTGAAYVPGLIRAYAVYSDMERTGSFTCENGGVRQLYSNLVWGQKSNYVEIPTDCPQRDERMGYTGDGHVFALTGAYNFDTERFWAKFLKDIRFSQMDNAEGYVAPTIPAQGPAGIGFLNMLGWGNCDTILPELLYLQYGTDRYLREQYGSMKLLVECEIRQMGDKNLWLGPNLGDWLMPGRDVGWMAMHNGPVSNAFIVNDLRILSRTAGYLGRKEDEDRYAAQLEKTRSAYLAAFVRPDGHMTDEYQGAYIMALRFVVQEEGLRAAMLARLVELIRTEGMQTGFFSTEHILPLLAEGGYARLAYDLLLQEDCPGWMYQVNRGATTVWERWDALRPDGTVNETKMSDDNMVSFNHYAFGSVGEFYYRYILGIRPLEPGFASVLIRPFPDERLGNVSGGYRSRHGEISVSWRADGTSVEISVSVPVKATVMLPDGTVHHVEAGDYRYVSRTA